MNLLWTEESLRVCFINRSKTTKVKIKFWPRGRTEETLDGLLESCSIGKQTNRLQPKTTNVGSLVLFNSRPSIKGKVLGVYHSLWCFWTYRRRFSPPPTFVDFTSGLIRTLRFVHSWLTTPIPFIDLLNSRGWTTLNENGHPYSVPIYSFLTFSTSYLLSIRYL